MGSGVKSQWLVSATHKSSGKTTVTLGLVAALVARGHSVQAFKKGPDYIDPMWLSLAAGRACINLDPMLMSADEIRVAHRRHAREAEVVLVEGNKGLYDGLALDGSNSNAALARQLDLPVLLVIDARGMTRGVAPLILGYQAFDPALKIGGVILNRLGGSRHEAKLRAVIEHYTDVPVLGALQEDESLRLVERHLGLMPDAEVDDARERVCRIGQRVAEQVDLDRLLSLGAAPAGAEDPAPDHEAVVWASATPAQPRVRIGVARDKAFGFYYPDDLAALEAAGAELVGFDTLRDPHLPAVDGLFIGGGFPELFMSELEANVSLRTEIHRAISDGLPSYAECGGLMYLARSLNWKGRSAQMVGVIPGDVVMHERPVGRGYVRLAPTPHLPWPASSRAEGASVLGHEFHYSSLENLDPDLRYAYRVERGHGIDGQRDGVQVHRLLASYAHLRHTGGVDWPQRFVAYVRQCAAPREALSRRFDQRPPRSPTCSI